VPHRVLSGRSARGKSRKLPSGKKNRSQRRARPVRRRRRLARHSSPASLLRKSPGRTADARPHAAASALKAGAVSPEKWLGLSEPEPAPGLHAPEELELKRKRAQLSVLEAELARQENQLSRLRAELHPFESRYFRKVGIRCAKLDEIEARIAELHASIHPDDMAAQETARRARERANRSRREVLERRGALGLDPPAALKRLYRIVARRVHPDLGETAADRQVRERLMAHANRAYQSGDERRLRAIISEYEFCPETVKGEGTPIDLVRVIRQIAQARGRTKEIQEELEKVRSSELFRFKLLVDSQARHGRDLFADAVAAVNTRIAGALLKLKHLETSPSARQGTN
jgi:hypothetical protein